MEFTPDDKAEFSVSLLQSTVSHDPSVIILIWWFDAQETFIIIINVKNSGATSYFCGNSDTFFRIHLINLLLNLMQPFWKKSVMFLGSCWFKLK